MSINRVENYKGFDNVFGFSNGGAVPRNGLSVYGDEYIDGNGGDLSVGLRGPSVFRSGVVIAMTGDGPDETTESQSNSDNSGSGNIDDSPGSGNKIGSDNDVDITVNILPNFGCNGPTKKSNDD